MAAGELLAEPIARKLLNLLQGARLLEQVRRTVNNRNLGTAAHLIAGGTIETQDLRIGTADDE